MVAVLRTREEVDEAQAHLIWCPFCGLYYPSDLDRAESHFIEVGTKPLRVTPRCQPDAVASWTNVVLLDALAAALQSPGPHS